MVITCDKALVARFDVAPPTATVAATAIITVIVVAHTRRGVRSSADAPMVPAEPKTRATDTHSRTTHDDTAYSIDTAATIASEIPATRVGYFSDQWLRARELPVEPEGDVVRHIGPSDLVQRLRVEDEQAGCATCCVEHDRQEYAVVLAVSVRACHEDRLTRVVTGLAPVRRGFGLRVNAHNAVVPARRRVETPHEAVGPAVAAAVIDARQLNPAIGQRPAVTCRSSRERRKRRSCARETGLPARSRSR